MPEASERPELEAPALSRLPQPTQDRARQLRERFWLDAGAVGSAPTIPASHLDALAAAGFFGIYAPVPEGGLALDYAAACAVVEELASGCVATTFLWIQHLRLLSAMLDPSTPASWRERLRADVISGRCKGGVVLTGLMPGPVRLTAEPEPDGKSWRLEGEAPWVSGWGIVDKLVVVARVPASRFGAGLGPSSASAVGAGAGAGAAPSSGPGPSSGSGVATFLIDAKERPGLTAAPARLSAINATRTVSLRFDGVVLPEEQVLRVHPYDEARATSDRLRMNGSFSLGLAKRCCQLLGPSALDGELVSRRDQLDAAGVEDMPAARAAASELAVRAAHALAVQRGSRAALAGDVAERLTREASLLLVFGSRPAIKAGLLERLEVR